MEDLNFNTKRHELTFETLRDRYNRILILAGFDTKSEKVKRVINMYSQFEYITAVLATKILSHPDNHIDNYRPYHVLKMHCPMNINPDSSQTPPQNLIATYGGYVTTRSKFPNAFYIDFLEEINNYPLYNNLVANKRDVGSPKAAKSLDAFEYSFGIHYHHNELELQDNQTEDKRDARIAMIFHSFTDPMVRENMVVQICHGMLFDHLSMARYWSSR